MKNKVLRVIITVALACGAAPVIGSYILALLNGGDNRSFWFGSSGTIPLWVFAPFFVAPFTIPAAGLLCLGSWWISRRQWRYVFTRIACFVFLGVVCSWFFPVFAALASYLMPFDATPYGITSHDQRVFIAQNLFAAGMPGLLGGILLHFLWPPNHRTETDANNSMQGTGANAPVPDL
ncbi:MAG: hypothetical protein H0X66_05130 [Verrucomicrobia bacterium]|nr:hypothetical protein [Verrucomicrobiota bacterium]